LVRWADLISEELQYVLLLFVLFVLPRVLQRFRLPSAISCVALGALAGIGLGVFHDDAALHLLSTFGIVSLFLFAGLDVEFKELRRNASFLTQHLIIRVVALVFLTVIISVLFKMPVQPAVLMGLALTTPSTGFILDSLGSLGVSGHERAWIKSKAIATELVALAILFLALQPMTFRQVLTSVLVLGAMVAFLPLVFRLFASVVLPHAPKSEFAFLLMVAVMCALVTRHLGAYYLVGAFIVGLTAQRFREQLPAIASEQMVHAVEVFASFFVPFYFFYAGVRLHREDFSLAAVGLGFAFLLVLVPLRVALVALHRSLALGESMRSGVRIGLSIIPTLVFTLVIAEILQERFGLSQLVFGGLVVYTLANTLIPGFVLRVPPPDLEHLVAPHLPIADAPEPAAGGSGQA